LLVPNLDQVLGAQLLSQLPVLDAEQHRAVLVVFVVAKGLLQTVQLVYFDVEAHALQHLGGVLGTAKLHEVVRLLSLALLFQIMILASLRLW